jgi:condensin complex subunit 1
VPLAELLATLAEEHDCAQMVTSVLREIGRMDADLLGKDLAGAKNVSAFLTALGELLPALVRANISLVLVHLDGDAYSMRNGIITMVGKLIQHAFGNNDSDDDSDDDDETDDDDENAAPRRRSGRRATAKQKKKDAKKAAAAAAAVNVDQENCEPGAAAATDAAAAAAAAANVASPEEEAAAREALFAVLEERIHDVSSYTRAKVLQTWMELAGAEAIPAEKYAKAAALAVDRLTDKTSAVRKYATTLLTRLLESNPFFPHLSLDKLNVELAEKAVVYQKFLQSKQQADSVADAAANDDDDAVAEPDAAAAAPVDVDDIAVGVDKLALKERDGDDAAAAAEAEAAKKRRQRRRSRKSLSLAAADKTDELAEKEAELKTYLNAVRFVAALHTGVAALSQLMVSKSSADTLVAIQFFVTAHQFRLDVAHAGVRRMLKLVWSKVPNAKEAVIDAYTQLYIGDAKKTLRRKGPANRVVAVSIAKNLVRLTVGVTMAELTSLEELITHMTKNGAIPAPVVDALVDIFANDIAGASISATHATGALTMLGMMANSDASIVVDNIKKIGAVGFGARAAGHLHLARAACMTLQKVKKSDWLCDDTVDAATRQAIIARLRAVIESGVYENARLKTPADRDTWFSAAEQALNTLFALHANPETITATIIQRMTGVVFPQDGTASVPPTPQSARSPSSAAVERVALAAPAALARLFFVVGHVCIKMLAHLEETEMRLKRFRSAQRTARNEASGGQESSSGKSAIEEELAMNASEDYEFELLKEQGERQLVTTGLLGAFAPMIAKVCKNPRRFAHRGLQQSAVLALCKFMCINVDFCEAHLRLLFTVLQQAAAPSVRANVIIALGDMAFRFPNLLEPWSKHMFGRLRDNDAGVRKNTLMVLTHLIINDMMKVKGPVAEIAKCLEDKEPKIADLARVFFQELSKKGENPVYNVLPDIISRLSNDTRVSHASFQFILKFLLGFIDKDKQTESLVDKLCHRFQLSIDDTASLELANDDLSLANTGDHKVSRAAENEVGVKVSMSVENVDLTSVDAVKQGVDGVFVRINLTVVAENLYPNAGGNGDDDDDDELLLNGAVPADETDKQRERRVKAEKRRLRAATVQQWRDVAFCLSLLNYSEKAFKKLQSSFRYYADKLFDDKIYAAFVTIVNKARRFAKAETKEMLAEFESSMVEARAKAVDDEQTSRNAQNVRMLYAHRDGDDEEFDLDAAAVAVAAAASAAKVAKPVDSDMFAFDDEPAKRASKAKGKPAAAKKKVTAKKGRARKVVVESSSDEDSSNDSDSDSDSDSDAPVAKMTKRKPAAAKKKVVAKKKTAAKKKKAPAAAAKKAPARRRKRVVESSSDEESE